MGGEPMELEQAGHGRELVAGDPAATYEGVLVLRATAEDYDNLSHDVRASQVPPEEWTGHDASAYRSRMTAGAAGLTGNGAVAAQVAALLNNHINDVKQGQNAGEEVFELYHCDDHTGGPGAVGDRPGALDEALGRRSGLDTPATTVTSSGGDTGRETLPQQQARQWLAQTRATLDSHAADTARKIRDATERLTDPGHPATSPGAHVPAPQHPRPGQRPAGSGRVPGAPTNLAAQPARPGASATAPVSRPHNPPALSPGHSPGHTDGPGLDDFTPLVSPHNPIAASPSTHAASVTPAVAAPPPAQPGTPGSGGGPIALAPMTGPIGGFSRSEFDRLDPKDPRRHHRVVVVDKPDHDGDHDNLFKMSQRLTGNGDNWVLLLDANRGLPQPDGRSLVNPALINPGQVFYIPDSMPVTPTALASARPGGPTLGSLAGGLLDPTTCGPGIRPGGLHPAVFTEPSHINWKATAAAAGGAALLGGGVTAAVMAHKSDKRGGDSGVDHTNAAADTRGGHSHAQEWEPLDPGHALGGDYHQHDRHGADGAHTDHAGDGPGWGPDPAGNAPTTSTDPYAPSGPRGSGGAPSGPHDRRTGPGHAGPARGGLVALPGNPDTDRPDTDRAAPAGRERRGENPLRLVPQRSSVAGANPRGILIELGTRGGQRVIADLTGLAGLGINGPAAAQALRGILATLHHSPPAPGTEQARLLIDRPLAAHLFGPDHAGADRIGALEIDDCLDDALSQLELEAIKRARRLRDDPELRFPPLVLFAQPTTASHRRQLAILLDTGRNLRLGALIHTDPHDPQMSAETGCPRTELTVSVDGTVIDTEGPAVELADTHLPLGLRGATLDLLTTTPAAYHGQIDIDQPHDDNAFGNSFDAEDDSEDYYSEDHDSEIKDSAEWDDAEWDEAESDDAPDEDGLAQDGSDDDAFGKVNSDEGSGDDEHPTTATDRDTADALDGLVTVREPVTRRRTAHASTDSSSPASGGDRAAAGSRSASVTTGTRSTGGPARAGQTTARVAPAEPSLAGWSGATLLAADVPDSTLLKISCLGSSGVLFEARTQPGAAFCDINAHLADKRRLGLSVLAAHPGGVAVEELLEAVWPDAQLTVARGRGQNMMSQLRSALRMATGIDGWITLTNHQHYRLNLDHAFTDLQAAEQALSRARGALTRSERIRELTEIARLACGPFAADLDGEWVETERARLARLHLDALGQLAELIDSPRRRITLLRRGFALDPTDRDTATSLISALAEAGERDHARQVLRDHTAGLDTIDLTPSPRLVDLIGDTDPPAAPDRTAS